MYVYYIAMVVLSLGSLIFSALGYYQLRKYLKSIDDTAKQAMKNIKDSQT